MVHKTWVLVVQKAGAIAVMSQVWPGSQLKMAVLDTVLDPKQRPYIVELIHPNLLVVSQIPQAGGGGQDGVDAAQTAAVLPQNNPLPHVMVGEVGSIAPVVG